MADILGTIIYTVRGNKECISPAPDPLRASKKGKNDPEIKLINSIAESTLKFQIDSNSRDAFQSGFDSNFEFDVVHGQPPHSLVLKNKIMQPGQTHRKLRWNLIKSPDSLGRCENHTHDKVNALTFHTDGDIEC